VHSGRWWRATGPACVYPDAGPWLSLHAAAPGPVTLVNGLSWPGRAGVSGCAAPE
jgi:hypothetical protein